MATLEELMAGLQPSQGDLDKRKWLMLMGASAGLLGARKGQVGSSLGRGLLGGMQMAQEYESNLRKRPYQQLQARGVAMNLLGQERAMQDQETARNLAKQYAQSAVPGLPEMGPPTEDGMMQPPVAAQPPRFDFGGYAAALGGAGLPDKALQYQQAMAKESPYDKIDPAKYTPNSVATFERTRNVGDLVAYRPPEKPDQPYDKPNPRDYTPGSFQAFVRSGSQDFSQLVPFDRSAKTNINIAGNKLESAEQVAKGGLNIKDFGSLKEVAGQARKENAILTSMERNPLQTGAGVPLVSTAANWLAYAGMAPDKIKAIAADSQKFKAAAMDLVLQKQLAQKGPQTESDAKRLEQSVASLGNTPAANMAIIKFGKAQNSRIIRQHDFYEKWWQTNRTMEGADSAWFSGEGGQSLFESPELRDVVSSSVAPGPPAGGLSPQEEARRKELRKQLGYDR